MRSLLRRFRCWTGTHTWTVGTIARSGVGTVFVYCEHCYHVDVAATEQMLWNRATRRRLTRRRRSL